MRPTFLSDQVCICVNDRAIIGPSFDNMDDLRQRAPQLQLQGLRLAHVANLDFPRIRSPYRTSTNGTGAASTAKQAYRKIVHCTAK